MPWASGDCQVRLECTEEEKRSEILGTVPIIWKREEEGKMLDTSLVCWFVKVTKPEVTHRKVWPDAGYGKSWSRELLME